MKYGLKPHIIRRINHVFSSHPKIEQGILYGSRAKGNYRQGSDIDIALKGNRLDLTEQFRIENELDELLLPYKIDISIYHKIENKDLINHIDRAGKVLYIKNSKEIDFE